MGDDVSMNLDRVPSEKEAEGSQQVTVVEHRKKTTVRSLAERLGTPFEAMSFAEGRAALSPIPGQGILSPGRFKPSVANRKSGASTASRTGPSSILDSPKKVGERESESADEQITEQSKPSEKPDGREEDPQEAQGMQSLEKERPNDREERTSEVDSGPLPETGEESSELFIGQGDFAPEERGDETGKDQVTPATEPPSEEARDAETTVDSGHSESKETRVPPVDPGDQALQAELAQKFGGGMTASPEEGPAVGDDASEMEPVGETATLEGGSDGSDLFTEDPGNQFFPALVSSPKPAGTDAPHSAKEESPPPPPMPRWLEEFSTKDQEASPDTNSGRGESVLVNSKEIGKPSGALGKGKGESGAETVAAPFERMVASILAAPEDTALSSGSSGKSTDTGTSSSPGDKNAVQPDDKKTSAPVSFELPTMPPPTREQSAPQDSGTRVSPETKSDGRESLTGVAPRKSRLTNIGIRTRHSNEIGAAIMLLISEGKKAANCGAWIELVLDRAGITRNRGKWNPHRGIYKLHNKADYDLPLTGNQLKNAVNQTALALQNALLLTPTPELQQALSRVEEVKRPLDSSMETLKLAEKNKNQITREIENIRSSKKTKLALKSAESEARKTATAEAEATKTEVLRQAEEAYEQEKAVADQAYQQAMSEAQKLKASDREKAKEKAKATKKRALDKASAAFTKRKKTAAVEFKRTIQDAVKAAIAKVLDEATAPQQEKLKAVLESISQAEDSAKQALLAAQDALRIARPALEAAKNIPAAILAAAEFRTSFRQAEKDSIQADADRTAVEKAVSSGAKKRLSKRSEDSAFAFRISVKSSLAKAAATVETGQKIRPNAQLQQAATRIEAIRQRMTEADTDYKNAVKLKDKARGNEKEAASQQVAAMEERRRKVYEEALALLKEVAALLDAVLAPYRELVQGADLRKATAERNKAQAIYDRRQKEFDEAYKAFQDAKRALEAANTSDERKPVNKALVEALKEATKRLISANWYRDDAKKTLDKKTGAERSARANPPGVLEAARSVQKQLGKEKNRSNFFRFEPLMDPKVLEDGVLQYGDWLYLYNGNSSGTGDHSVIFLGWIDKAPQEYTPTLNGMPLEKSLKRTASVAHQLDPSKGGEIGKQTIGIVRSENPWVCPITRIFTPE